MSSNSHLGIAEWQCFQPIVSTVNFAISTLFAPYTGLSCNNKEVISSALNGYSAVQRQSSLPCPFIPSFFWNLLDFVLVLLQRWAARSPGLQSGFTWTAHSRSTVVWPQLLGLLVGKATNVRSALGREYFVLFFVMSFVIRNCCLSPP